MNKKSDNYQDVLSESRKAVQDGLDQAELYMRKLGEEAPGALSERLLKIMERKGKRIRSTLFFLLTQTGTEKPNPDRCARVAASIELLHLASLVHDDIIDATELRRGVGTAHAHWGNQMAVLVGDYALSKSMELVVSDEDRRIPVIVSAASSKLVAGEVLELDMAGNTEMDLRQYMDVIQGKTAALIEACTLTGAILAGHDNSLVKKCGTMGCDFGIAFQIIDDLLDFGVGAQNLGKATWSDLGNEVITLPLLLHLQFCTVQERNEFRGLMARAGEREAREKIYTGLTRTGSFEATRRIALDHVRRSEEVIEALPGSDSRRLLLQMCSTMTTRGH